MDNPKILRRYTPLPIVIDMLLNKQVTLVSYKSWVDQNDQRSLEIYQSALNWDFLGAMCLTEVGETFHHWSVFAGGSAGICIVFDKTRFRQMFEGYGHFQSNPVEYVQLDRLDALDASDLHRLPFIKRWGFRDEREYRVIGYALGKSLKSLSVELDPLAIDRIVISPFIHPSIADSVGTALRRLPDWGELKIEHSKLINNQKWQTALADYRERHGLIYSPWIESEMTFVDE